MNISDIEYIRELARILSGSGLTRIDVSDGNAKIVLEQAGNAPPAAWREEAPVVFGRADNEGRDIINFNAMTEVQSPIVGVFYSAPSPDAESFVSIGDAVKKGDVLCVIEAMKLLNEVTAERDGKIADICVKNGDVVEFGQVLFKIADVNLNSDEG